MLILMLGVRRGGSVIECLLFLSSVLRALSDEVIASSAEVVTRFTETPVEQYHRQPVVDSGVVSTVSWESSTPAYRTRSIPSRRTRSAVSASAIPSSVTVELEFGIATSRGTVHAFNVRQTPEVMRGSPGKIPARDFQQTDCRFLELLTAAVIERVLQRSRVRTVVVRRSEQNTVRFVQGLTKQLGVTGPLCVQIRVFVRAQSVFARRSQTPAHRHNVPRAVSIHLTYQRWTQISL